MMHRSRIPALVSGPMGPLGVVLRSAGFQHMDQLPAFVKVIDHGLIAWMAQNLTAEMNCLPDDATAGAEARDSSTDQALGNDELLIRFDELQGCDVTLLNDQDRQTVPSCMGSPYWLSNLGHADIDERSV